MLEGCSKQAEFRAIVFGLAYFHAAMLERKKFGVGNLPGATSGMHYSYLMIAECDSLRQLLDMYPRVLNPVG